VCGQKKKPPLDSAASVLPSGDTAMRQSVR
jgi:hypothetical protein